MGLTTALASRFTLLLGCSGRLGEKKSTTAFFRVLSMVHTRESRRKISSLTRLHTCTLTPPLSHSHNLNHIYTTSFILTPPPSHSQHLLHTHTTCLHIHTTPSHSLPPSHSPPPSHSHHFHTHTPSFTLTLPPSHSHHIWNQFKVHHVTEGDLLCCFSHS